MSLLYFRKRFEKGISAEIYYLNAFVQLLVYFFPIPSFFSLLLKSSLAGKICDGKPYDRSCCTREAPCAINQGDCDRSNQCQGNLVCGKNNCPVRFPKNADCCTYGFGNI